MKKNKPSSISSYGFETPEDFFDQNKHKLLKEMTLPRSLKLPWQKMAIAASFFLLIGWWTQQESKESDVASQWKEDPFVTDLLINTLLLEEELLDETLSVAILNDLETQPPQDNE